MKTAELIDLARQRAGIPSDYALAKVFGVTRQTISGWRAGVRLPDTMHVFDLAEMAGLEPARCLAELERERAERTGRADAAASWRRWLEKAAGAVAAVAGAVILSAFGMVPQEAYASYGAGGSAGPDWRAELYIHCRAWRRRRKSRRAAQHAAHAQAARAAADRSTL